MPARTVVATRYVTPLREGGSLPAIVEGDDLGLYVVKFRGAGQGAKALVAEWIAGEIGRAIGLPVPDLVLVDVDADLARTEPDPEIQDLIRASAGVNLGVDYLPGATTFDPIADRIDAALASSIVWFDAYMSNLDRTARNTNMLVWHRKIWLIDHGAALYLHHAPGGLRARAGDLFAKIAEHVLLPFASGLAATDAELAQRLTPAIVESVLAGVPQSWLDPDATIARERQLEYVDYLVARLAPPRRFAEEALRARSANV